MRALKEIFVATRRLFKQWRVIIILAAVYASLLATLLLFMATKEATIWQVMLTLVFAALAPALFFLLQAMIVNYAQGEARAPVLLRRSFRDSCKLALASLPLALLAVFFLYFLNKLQSYFPVHVPSPRPVQVWWPVGPPQQSSVEPTPWLRWPLLMLSSLRFLVFGVALPLCAAHVWSATVREGLPPALKRMPQHLARAFSTDTVLIYTVGLILFGLVPYFLLFTHTPASRPSVEFGLFIARLLLVFIFTLCGWVLTLDALASAGKVRAAETSDPATWLTGEAA
jgi:hypothetical protein